MESITAVIHNGRIELAQPVEWPDGTRVEVRPINNPLERTDWLSLPPIGVGEFREPVSDKLEANQVSFRRIRSRTGRTCVGFGHHTGSSGRSLHA